MSWQQADSLLVVALLLMARQVSFLACCFHWFELQKVPRPHFAEEVVHESAPDKRPVVAIVCLPIGHPFFGSNSSLSVAWIIVCFITSYFFFYVLSSFLFVGVCAVQPQRAGTRVLLRAEMTRALPVLACTLVFLRRFWITADATSCLFTLTA